MIAPEVLELAANLRKRFQAPLTKYPEFQLDFSWPSVGTIDLLTYHLRGEGNYSLEERTLVREAAAYLACMAHDCWTRYPGVEVTVEKTTNLEFDISITARGGEFLGEGNTFTVLVTEALRKVLAYKGNFFLFFAKKGRVLQPTHNLISLFGIGLVTGLCPVGKGLWFDLDEASFLPYLKETHQYLAQTSAAYYKERFPNEPLGQSPDLYLCGLILPPAHHTEMFPACRAVAGLITYLKHHQVSPNQMRQVAENLGRSPDELISSAGFALACALTEADPSAELLSLSLAQGIYAAELRPAVITARKLLDKPHDISECLDKGEIEQAIKLAELEKQLGLAPLLFFPTKLFHLSALHKLIAAVLWFNPQRAREELDALDQGDTFPKEVILQGIYLDLVMGNFARAEKDLKRIEPHFSTESVQIIAKLYSLFGLYFLDQGNFDQSFIHYEKSFSLCDKGSLEHESIGNQIARILILRSDFKLALQVLNDILAHHPGSLLTKIQRAMVYRELGLVKELASELQVLRFASTDKRVFDLIVNLPGA